MGDGNIGLGGTPSGARGAELRSEIDSLRQSIERIKQPVDTGGWLEEHAGGIRTALEGTKAVGKMAGSVVDSTAEVPFFRTAFEFADGAGHAIAGNDARAREHVGAAVVRAASNGWANAALDLKRMAENIGNGEWSKALGDAVDAAKDIGKAIGAPAIEAVKQLGDTLNFFKQGKIAAEGALQDADFQRNLENHKTFTEEMLARLEANLASKEAELDGLDRAAEPPQEVPKSEAPKPDSPVQAEAPAPESSYWGEPGSGSADLPGGLESEFGESDFTANDGDSPDSGEDWSDDGEENGDDSSPEDEGYGDDDAFSAEDEYEHESEAGADETTEGGSDWSVEGFVDDVSAPDEQGGDQPPPPPNVWADWDADAAIRQGVEQSGGDWSAPPPLPAPPPMPAPDPGFGSGGFGGGDAGGGGSGFGGGDGGFSGSPSGE